MNAPLSRSKFGKKFSDNFDRIFKKEVVDVWHMPKAEVPCPHGLVTRGCEKCSPKDLLNSTCQACGIGYYHSDTFGLVSCYKCSDIRERYESR